MYYLDFLLGIIFAGYITKQCRTTGLIWQFQAPHKCVLAPMQGRHQGLTIPRTLHLSLVAQNPTFLKALFSTGRRRHHHDKKDVREKRNQRTKTSCQPTLVSEANQTLSCRGEKFYGVTLFI